MEGCTLSSEPIPVGSQRHLFLDDIWFARQENVERVLHPPQLREIVLESDRPWEGGGVHYSCVLQDGLHYRMWYRADEGTTGDSTDENALVCYAESQDGIHWKKPDLGLVETYNGGANNNIFHRREQGINPSVILDPNAAPDEPISGFALEDCVETFGDRIEGSVRWQKGEDVSTLSGQPVRLRIRLRDAHLYAFRFAE